MGAAAVGSALLVDRVRPRAGRRRAVDVADAGDNVPPAAEPLVRV